MPSKDKRCGTCTWFYLYSGELSLGECVWRPQESFPVCWSINNRTYRNNRVPCACWEAKDGDATEENVRLATRMLPVQAEASQITHSEPQPGSITCIDECSELTEELLTRVKKFMTRRTHE